MKGKMKHKLFVYVNYFTILLIVLILSGCLTTKSARMIPRANFFDNEYSEYYKLDSKQPPVDKIEEHLHKIQENGEYRQEANNLEIEVVKLETGTIPDLQAEVTYLEGRVSSQNDLKNAYLASITDSMHRIWSFNNESLNVIKAKNETCYIPLGVPAFKRDKVWNPTVEKNGLYSLIVDVSHPAKSKYYPVEGEIYTSFMGKYRFVIIKRQVDGGMVVLPLGDKSYEITENDKQDGLFYKKVSFQTNLQLMQQGDCAGIIVENRLGACYDSSSSIDAVSTGNVLLLPIESFENLPQGKISVDDEQHNKEMSFSFSVLGRYDK